MQTKRFNHNKPEITSTCQQKTRTAKKRR